LSGEGEKEGPEGSRKKAMPYDDWRHLWVSVEDYMGSSGSLPDLEPGEASQGGCRVR